MQTLVTGFFDCENPDLRNDKNLGQVVAKAYDLLSAKCFLGIYCLPKYAPLIRAIRKQSDPDLVRTRIISTDSLSPLECLRKSLEFSTGHLYWTVPNKYVPFSNSDRIQVVSPKYQVFSWDLLGGSLSNVEWLVDQTSDLGNLIKSFPERFQIRYGSPNDLVHEHLHRARIAGNSEYSRKLGAEFWPDRHLLDSELLLSYLDEYLVAMSNKSYDNLEPIGEELSELVGSDDSDNLKRIRDNLDYLKIRQKIKLTLVTSITDLGSLQILTWHAPLVIYCPPDLALALKAARTKHDPEWEISEIVPEIFPGDDLSRKMNYLEQVIQRNSFSANRFVYLDSDLSDSVGFYDYALNFTGKIKILMRSYPKDFSLKLIGGGRNSLLWLGSQLSSQTSSLLTSTFPAQILPKIWKSDPKRFDLIYGDPQDVIENIDYPKRNFAVPIWNVMNSARNASDPQTSYRAGVQLWKGRSLMSPRDRLAFLDEYLIASHSTDSGHLQEIGEELYPLVKEKEGIDDHNQKRILDNFEYLNLKFQDVPVKITFVTAFYDLRKRDKTEAKTQRRNPEVYLDLAKKKTLALNHPMIIYCDPEYTTRIRQIRASLTSAPTEVIPRTMEDWEYEKYRDFATQAFSNGKMVPLRIKYPWKITHDYCLLMWTKFACLGNAIKWNPFESNRIAWIDFGLGYLIDDNPDFGKYFESSLANFSSRIKITQRWYINPEIIRQENFYVGDGFAFAGGFFGGSLENMAWFRDRFNEEVAKLVSEGWCLLDEQIFPRITLADPDRFNLSYGNYCHLIDNLDGPRQGHKWIVDWLMNSARNRGNDLEFSAKIGKALWPYRESMDAQLLISYLDEYFVACGGSLPEVSSALVKAMYECKNQANIDRIRANLVYCGSCLPKVPFEIPNFDLSLTFVTCFYDLSRREKNSTRRSPAEYLKCSEFTLGLNFPMVIFCDPEYEDQIRKIRGKPKLTRIIPKPLEEWSAWTHLGKVEPMYGPEGSMAKLKAYGPNKFTPGYCLLTWSKFECLEAALKLNSFKTSRMAWLDIGLSHMMAENSEFGKHFPGNLTSLTDKIKILCRMCPNPKDTIRDNPELMFSFAGGFFGGSLENMSWFAKRIREEIPIHLEEGLGPLEEQMFPKIYLKDASRFDLCYGNYIHLLDNLETPHQGNDWIVTWVMNRARNIGNLETSRNCGKELWKVRDKMTPEVLFRFLDEYYVGMYSTDKGYEIGAELEKILEHPSIKPEPENLARILENLRFVGIKKSL